MVTNGCYLLCIFRATPSSLCCTGPLTPARPGPAAVQGALPPAPQSGTIGPIRTLELPPAQHLRPYTEPWPLAARERDTAPGPNALSEHGHIRTGSEPPLGAAGREGLPAGSVPGARAPPAPPRPGLPAPPPRHGGHVSAVLVSPRGGSHAPAHVTGRRGGMARG